MGYVRDHYVVQLPETCKGPRYDDIKNLSCEIQVRTVSTHAWATISHHLDYKQEIDIPSNLKNDFFALSGVFYIADSLFEQFRGAREKIVNAAKSSVGAGERIKGEINYDTMMLYLPQKFPNRVFDSEATRIFMSVLLQELREADITTYEQLDKVIDEHMKAFEQYEREKPPTKNQVVKDGVITWVEYKTGEKREFYPLGVVRVILKRFFKPSTVKPNESK